MSAGEAKFNGLRTGTVVRFDIKEAESARKSKLAVNVTVPARRSRAVGHASSLLAAS